LHSFRERIRVNGQLISPEAVVARVNVLRPHADTVVGLTAWEVIATQANHPRATRPAVLAAAARSLGVEIATAPTVEQALNEALAQAGERDLICVAGSLFCAAEARLVWAKQNGGPLPETDPV